MIVILCLGGAHLALFNHLLIIIKYIRFIFCISFTWVECPVYIRILLKILNNQDFSLQVSN